jgi:molybdopterin-guanine dinucleotide biosynthesis protein A
VLAGGRSTRFGRDKLLEPLDGEPLLWRSIRALAGVCDEGSGCHGGREALRLAADFSIVRPRHVEAFQLMPPP